MTDKEKILYWLDDFNLRLEKLEYCTYKRTRKKNSQIEMLRKEFEDGKAKLMKEMLCKGE